VEYDSSIADAPPMFIVPTPDNCTAAVLLLLLCPLCSLVAVTTGLDGAVVVDTIAGTDDVVLKDDALLLDTVAA
jgi:hypothetical protein